MTMILKDLIEIIERSYPKNLACEWDNPGLILGDFEREVKKVLLSVDVTEDILLQAIKKDVDLIISHHPFVFSGLKQINSQSVQGKILLRAAENKIALYAAHTNMDAAPDGINKTLSDMFFLKNSTVIEPKQENKNAGLGRIGYIEKTTLELFLEQVKKILDIPFVRYSGNDLQIIEKVAIGSGSSSDLIQKSIELGADTIITGDLKYHTCIDYASDNFSIIDAGHFATEKIVLDMFFDVLKNSNVEIIKAKQEDIFKLG